MDSAIRQALPLVLLTCSAGVLLPPTANAAETSLDQRYSERRDELVVELRCNRDTIQRHELCVNLRARVKGARITPEASRYRIFSFAPTFVFSVPPPWTQNCANFRLLTDTSVVDLLLVSTTSRFFRNQEYANQKVCRATEKEAQKEPPKCDTLRVVGAGAGKLPPHLVGETQVDIEFRSWSWCEIASLRAAKTAALDACGERLEINRKALARMRDFAALFPRPAGFGCEGGRMVRACDVQACASPEQRVKMVMEAQRVVLEVANILTGSDCESVAEQIRALTENHRTTLVQAAVVRPHLTAEQSAKITAMLQPKIDHVQKHPERPCWKDQRVELAWRRFLEANALP